MDLLTNYGQRRGFNQSIPASGFIDSGLKSFVVAKYKQFLLKMMRMNWIGR